MVEETEKVSKKKINLVGIIDICLQAMVELEDWENILSLRGKIDACLKEIAEKQKAKENEDA